MSYVALDPSNPGRIVMGDSAAAVHLPSLEAVPEDQQAPVKKPSFVGGEGGYVRVDPSNPNLVIAMNNGISFDEDVEDELDRLNSTTDSFVSAVQSLSHLSPTTESPYEIPLEVLMRRRGTPLLFGQSVSQRSLEEEEEAKEKIPPPLPHRNVPAIVNTSFVRKEIEARYREERLVS